MGRIIVVGAGITGVSSAEWLRRDGWEVTLVDPLMPGDPGQTSFGNAGLIARTSILPVASRAMIRKAPSMLLDPDSPLFLRWSYLPRLLPWLLPLIRNASEPRTRQIAEALSAMTFDANDQHMALARGTGAEVHVARGEYVHLFASRKDFAKDTLGAELSRAYGVAPEELDRATLEERDPNLGPAYGFGALYRDFRWITAPGAYVAALFDHYRREGGRFRQAKVVDITPGEEPSVTLEGGERLSADRIVLAAGAWSGPMAKRLGVAMRLEAERGYHVAMHGASITAPHPYMVTDAKFVLTPMAGLLRAAGVVEFAGLDAPAIEAPTRLIARGVQRVYPGLTYERAETWMGRRPTTPDSLPALGESPTAPNVIHAYGGQHVGLTIGPKLGRLVADLAGRRAVNMDLAPYRPDRFRGVSPRNPNL